MILIVEGAVTSRSSYTSEKGKTYLGVKMTDTTTGDEIKLACEKSIWESVPGLILKGGKWQLNVSPITFGNQNSSLNVTAIQPYTGK